MKSKALLLLCIFLLNTVAGFSCALHMSHHEHDEIAKRHEHHHPASAIVHHDQQHLPYETAVSKNDPCCQGAVNNFIALAKLIPPSGHFLLQAPFFYINTSYQFLFKPLSGIKLVHLISINERQRPPTRNIRIVIQSFLI